MKLFASLLLTTFWTFAAARIGEQVDEDNRDLQGIERIKIIVFEKDIIRSEYGQIGVFEQAPFYLKDDETTEAGYWHDTQFYGQPVGNDYKCLGLTTVTFKKNANSVSLQYDCDSKADIITGGAGKYLGAKGEAIYNTLPDRRTTLLKILL